MPLIKPLAGLCLAYFAAGKAGLSLASVHPSASAVWPPTGIALAAFLLRGYRVWPAIFLGAFLVNITTAGSGGSSLGIAIGNTLEGLAAAYLLKRFAGGLKTLDRPAGVFKFALLAAALSPIISASCGVASLALSGFAARGDSGPIWLTWWMGDAAGALVVAPAIILLRAKPPRWRRGRGLELTLLLAFFVLTGQIVFGDMLSRHIQPYPYMCLPILLWTAFRFGQCETALAALAMSAMAVMGTIEGRGPFSRADPNGALLSMQMFMGFISLTGLAVAAAVGEAEKAKERSEDRFFRLVDAVKDYAIFMLGADGTVLTWNNGAGRITGYRDVEIIGRHFSCLFTPEDNRKGKPQQELAEAAREGKLEEEGWRLRKDGSRFVCHVLTTAIRGEAGEVVGFAKVTHDITERKRAQEVESLREKAAIQAKFLATVSHELRTPLAAIRGFAETLRRGAIDDPVNRMPFVQIIEKHAGFLSELVEDLLEISAREHGKRPLKAERLKLGGFIDGFLRSIEPLAAKNNVSLEQNVPEEAEVLADGAQLLQIFQNLCSNALESVPAGGRILVEGRVEGDRIVLSVRDTGSGIAENDLPHIFERFYWAGKSRTRDRRGTGLGLAIVKDIVEAHAGNIWAENVPGLGAAFHFTLPLAAISSSSGGNSV